MELGELKDRALAELENVFCFQDEMGFVPHINYFEDLSLRDKTWAKRWGRTHSSSITQPPMYCHAIAEMNRRGIEIPAQLTAKAELGLNFLLNHRKRDPQSGLVLMCHPWESGMDDNPRWDSYYPEGFSPIQDSDSKLNLLKSIEFSGSDGSGSSPLYNPNFPVGSVGFNALLAFNCLELAALANGQNNAGVKNNAGVNSAKLLSAAEEIIKALEARFSPELNSWLDSPAIPIRTLDALLVGLVSDQHLDLIFEQLANPQAFGGEFGPPSVHRQEASFQPDAYWRGSVWPQMTYLFWLMAKRNGQNEIAENLAQALLKGVLKSGFAEHWNADTGEGLGAIPQSWAGLVLLTL